MKATKGWMIAWMGLVWMGCSAGAALGQATQPAGAIAPVVTFVNPSGLVGQALHLNATSSDLGGGDWLESRFDWDFGDPAGAHNRLTGFNAAHVYDSAGTYTITLRATDSSGRSGSTTRQVKIVEPSRRTYYLSAEGSDSNPGTLEAPRKTLAKIAGALRQPHTRICFRRGDTFEYAANVPISADDVILDAYGEAARPRPVLFFRGSTTGVGAFSTSATQQDLCIQNLTFDAAGAGNTQKDLTATVLKHSGANATLRNCQLLNVLYGVESTGSPRGLLMADNVAPSIRGLRAYFAWLTGSNVVIVGNTVANSTVEHIIRGPNITHLLICNNDLSNIDRSFIDPLETGAVSSATETTLSDAGKSWRPNALANYTVEITAGTGSHFPVTRARPTGHQRFRIVSNTPTTLTVEKPWTKQMLDGTASVQPDATSQYAVYDSQDTSKATLAVRYGKFWRIADNVLREGGAGFGPFADAIAVQKIKAGDKVELARQIPLALEYFVFERNRMIGAGLAFSGGVHHAVFRDNDIAVHNNCCVGILCRYSGPVPIPWVIDDVRVEHNTGSSDHYNSQFVQVEHRSVGAITLTNNLFSAPRLGTDPYPAAAVRVMDADLGSFKSISGNVWQIPPKTDKTGGINIVNNLRLTPAAWNAMPPVAGDFFEVEPLANRHDAGARPIERR